MPRNSACSRAAQQTKLSFPPSRAGCSSLDFQGQAAMRCLAYSLVPIGIAQHPVRAPWRKTFSLLVPWSARTLSAERQLAVYRQTGTFVN